VTTFSCSGPGWVGVQRQTALWIAPRARPECHAQRRALIFPVESAAEPGPAHLDTFMRQVFPACQAIGLFCSFERDPLFTSFFIKG